MKKELLDSKKKIKNAYISMLRRKETPNVREICRIAGVNKSTFYYYYSYLEELEKELYKEEAQVLYAKLVSGVDFSNLPDNYMESVYKMIKSVPEKHRILYYHNKALAVDMIIELAVESSKKHNSDIHNEMILKVFLRGGLSLLLDPNYSEEDKSVVLARIIRSYNKRDI